jgi:hypothetical protein
LFDRQDHGAVPAREAEELPAAGGDAARMLALQRSAGNAAVARFIAAGSHQVAREDDGYMAEATPQDADDSLFDESSEEEAETGMDPGAQLAAAVTARVQETGTVATPPPGPPPGLDSVLRGTNAYDASEGGGEVGYTLYSSRDEEADESEVSEDEPAPPLAPPPASGSASAVPYTLYGAQPRSDVYDDDMSEVSEDEPAPTSYSVGSVPLRDDDMTEISEDESESGPPPGLVSYSSAPERPPRPSTPAPERPPAIGYTEPPKPGKRKGKVKRALKAIAKPFKAIGSAVKKAGKRLKGSKKKPKLTPAELLADAYDAPEETVPVAPPLEPTKYAVRSMRDLGVSGSHPLASISSSSSSEADVSEDDVSFSEDIPAPPPTKYAQLAKMQMSATEEVDSSAFLNNTLLAGYALVHDMKRFGLAALQEDNATVMADRKRVREALKRVWGWSDADIGKYFDFKTNRAKQSKVEYIRNEADLQKFVVHAGPSLTYGDPPQPFDTGGLVSKASGPGYAIFVMDPQGNIYAGQHRVGLFHHSSFLAGRDVAAAGEIKVTGGKLTHLTAKSGHYFPSPENTWQVVKEMAGAGVSFNGVMIKVWVTGGSGGPETKVHEGADFLARGPNAKVVTTVGMFQ